MSDVLVKDSKYDYFHCYREAVHEKLYLLFFLFYRSIMWMLKRGFYLWYL